MGNSQQKHEECLTNYDSVFKTLTESNGIVYCVIDFGLDPDQIINNISLQTDTKTIIAGPGPRGTRIYKLLLTPDTTVFKIVSLLRNNKPITKQTINSSNWSQNYEYNKIKEKECKRCENKECEFSCLGKKMNINGAYVCDLVEKYQNIAAFACYEASD